MLGIRVRSGAVLLLALVTSSAQESVQGPGEAEFAKGGKPGKPQDDQVTLIEYWIEDGNLIHIVGQGDVDALRLSVTPCRPPSLCWEWYRAADRECELLTPRTIWTKAV